MSQTFKYTGSGREIGYPFEVRLSEGQTIEIPDEQVAQFEADPEFVSSRVKNPDVVTGPVPVQQPTEPAPAV